MRVLITEGLGDFFVLDTYLTQQERNSVHEIMWASRARYAIQPLVSLAPVFPNLKKQTIIWDTWEECDTANWHRLMLFAFASSDHLLEVNKERSLGLNPKILDGVTDWSIYRIFPQIREGKRLLQQSTFVKHTIADISKFALPSQYVVINPYSPNDRQAGKRDFTPEEWDAVLAWLRHNNLPAVVINTSEDFIPVDKLIINLSRQTTIVESLEIVKKCSYYIGIDSWIPAVASKILDCEHMNIKTVSDHYIQWLDLYLAPHVNFYFVHNNLEYLAIGDSCVS